MKQLFANIWQHPKTTVIGILLSLVTITGIFEQQGVTLGHAGTGTVAALIGAIAMGLLSMVSKDWGSKSNDSSSADLVSESRASASTTTKLGAFALIALLAPMPFVAGCTANQVNDTVAKISAFLPTAISLTNEALTIYGAIESSSTDTQPSRPYSVLQTVQADLSAIQKPIDDYLHATSAQSKHSAWLNIEAATDTAASDADTLLTEASVKNTDSQKQGVIIIASIDAAVHVIDGYVASTQTVQQAQARSARRTVKLQAVSRYWSESDKRMVGQAFGIPYQLALARAESAGF